VGAVALFSADEGNPDLEALTGPGVPVAEESESAF